MKERPDFRAGSDAAFPTQNLSASEREAVQAEVRLLISELGTAKEVARALDLPADVVADIARRAINARARALRAILKYRGVDQTTFFEKHTRTADDPRSSNQK